MQISLTRPDLEKFIADQLDRGRFDSAEELVEAALHHLMTTQDADSGDFDVEAIAAILRADAQCERGEGMDLADVAAQLRKRASEL